MAALLHLHLHGELLVTLAGERRARHVGSRRVTVGLARASTQLVGLQRALGRLERSPLRLVGGVHGRFLPDRQGERYFVGSGH